MGALNTKARPMSADEKRWQTEDDARALARAAEIRADAERHKAAAAHAKKKRRSCTSAQAMRSVAAPADKKATARVKPSPLKVARGR